MKPILDQLLDYYQSEALDKGRMPLDEMRDYFDILLKNNMIFYELDDQGNLMALMEIFFLDDSQAHRVVCDGHIYPRGENVTDGNICYVHDVWIRPDHRQNGGMKIIRGLRKKAEKKHGKKEGILLKEHKYGRFRLFDGRII